MADLKDLAAKRSALLWFPPSHLEIKPGLNARDFTDPTNIEHVEEKRASIVANGFYPSSPIAIFREVDKDGKEHIFIADGECRWRGAMLAIERGELPGFESDDKPGFLVACVILPRGMNDVDIVLHRNLANTGKRFTPIEEGHNIKHAIALGATIADIAAKLGKSVSYVNDVLAWQEAPAEVHNMVKAGEVSQTEANKVVKELGGEAGKEVLKEAVQVAKKAGKKKATAKYIKPVKASKKPAQVALTIDPEKIKIVDRGPSLVEVKLDGNTFDRAFWTVLARRILSHMGVEEIAA